MIYVTLSSEVSKGRMIVKKEFKWIIPDIILGTMLVTARSSRGKPWQISERITRSVNRYFNSEPPEYDSGVSVIYVSLSVTQSACVFSTDLGQAVTQWQPNYTRRKSQVSEFLCETGSLYRGQTQRKLRNNWPTYVLRGECELHANVWQPVVHGPTHCCSHVWAVKYTAAAAALPTRVSNSDARRVHPTSISNLVYTETFVDTLTFNTKTRHWTRASLARLLKTRLIILRSIQWYLG